MTIRVKINKMASILLTVISAFLLSCSEPAKPGTIDYVIGVPYSFEVSFESRYDLYDYVNASIKVLENKGEKVSEQNKQGTISDYEQLIKDVDYFVINKNGSSYSLTFFRKGSDETKEIPLERVQTDTRSVGYKAKSMFLSIAHNMEYKATPAGAVYMLHIDYFFPYGQDNIFLSLDPKPID